MLSFNKTDFNLKKMPNLTIFAKKQDFFFEITIICRFRYLTIFFGGKNEQQNPGSS